MPKRFLLYQKKEYILILLALIIAFFHQAVFLSWTNDDAFISFRYAENLSSGRGLTFNPGERVEGFSNFLWVIIIAFFDFLGFAPIWSSKIISFCSSLLMIFLVFKTVKAYGLNKFTSSLCALILSFSSSLAYYSMSGLETVFYTFLLLLSVFINEKYENELSEKSFFALYGVLLIAAITRPEGLLFLLISSSYHFLKKIITKKGIDLKKIFKVQLLSFLIYAFFIILRYWYYADIFPNTFYAKPKGTFVEQGLNAFYTNFISALFSGSFLLIPIFFLLVKKKYLEKYLYPILFCIGQLIFMSYVGDWMAFGRFFLPILPIVIILFFILLSLIRSHYEKSKLKLVWQFIHIIIIVLFIGLNAYQTKKAFTNKDVYPYLVMNSSQFIKLGKWLNQNFPQETVIAIRRQGTIPYYSEMKSIDILGLTEKEIARTIFKEKDITIQNQINAEYILNQRPDVIILFSFKSKHEGWTFDKSNPDDKFFHIEYSLYNLAVKNEYNYLKWIPIGRKENAHLLVTSGKFPINRD